MPLLVTLIATRTRVSVCLLLVLCLHLSQFEYVGYAIIAFFVISAVAAIICITCPRPGGCKHVCADVATPSPV